jgi:hypothetical protein
LGALQNFNEKEIFSLPLLQIIKIIPKQIHIQLKNKKNKKNKKKKGRRS